jgi:hypothetical protein
VAGDAPDVRYAVCAATVDEGAATAICTAEGGTLVGARFSGMADLVDAALELVDGPLLVAGACRDETGPIPCASGRPLCRLETGAPSE